MIKKYLFLLIILVFSCSKYKGSKDSLNYNNITIFFNGYGDYETKDKIIISITDYTQIKKLNSLKNESTRNWFPNLKGTEYVVKLVYSDSNNEEKLLINISKSTDATATVEYGAGTLFDGKYQNEKLVNYIASIIKLKDIKQYKGSLSQKEYEKL